MSGFGRHWKVFCHGVAYKKSKAFIVSNIQLSTIDQGTSKANEAHKWIYGSSENGNDEGALLAEIL
jgi:hypothetical protein